MNRHDRRKSVLTATEVPHQASAAPSLLVGHCVAGHTKSEPTVAEHRWPLYRLCRAAFLALALMLLISVLTRSWQQTLLYDLFVSVFFSGAMIGCYLLLSPRSQRVSALRALNHCPGLSLLRFALGPGLLTLLLAIVYCYWRFEPVAAAEAVETISLSSTISFLLLLVVVGPLFEEILFRQLLLQTLIEKFRAVWPAALCSALVFAAVHSMSTEQHLWLGVQLHQLLVFMAAMLLSWVRLRFDNLWPAIVLHVAYNLGVALMSFYLAA